MEIDVLEILLREGGVVTAVAIAGGIGGWTLCQRSVVKIYTDQIDTIRSEFSKSEKECADKIKELEVRIRDLEEERFKRATEE